MELFDKNGRHLWGWRTPACFANEALQEICLLKTTIADQWHTPEDLRQTYGFSQIEEAMCYLLN